MNAHHNDWTPDKVLDTVREYVDAGALSECAALDLLERLPLPLLGWTLEEYAVRASLEASDSDAVPSDNIFDSIRVLTKTMEKLVKLSATSARVRHLVPIEQVLQLIQLGLSSRYPLVRTAALRLLCLLLERNDLPEAFCQQVADTIIERFESTNELRPEIEAAQAPGPEVDAPSTTAQHASDILSLVLLSFRDDPSTEAAGLCEKILKNLVQLKPFRGAVVLFSEARGAQILVQEMLSGAAGAVAHIRALNLLLEICDYSSVAEIAARRLLPTVLVAKIAAPVRLDEDLLLRLNLLDVLGAFMQRSAIAAELLDQISVFDVLLRQHLAYLLAPDEPASSDLAERWFIWMCGILRFVRTSAGSSRCAFHAWMNANLVEILGRFLLLHVVDGETETAHWSVQLDQVRRTTLLVHLISAVGALGLCERGMDVLLADVDTLKLTLRFIQTASVCDIRVASLRALSVFLAGLDEPLSSAAVSGYGAAESDLEFRQQRVLHLFTDAIRDADPVKAFTNALPIVLDCARHPSEEERLAAAAVFAALGLSRIGVVALASMAGFVEWLCDPADASLEVLEAKMRVARRLVELHASDGEVAFGALKWSRIVAVVSNRSDPRAVRQQRVPAVNIATLNR